MKIKKGDLVEVTAGNWAGRRGKIIRVIGKKDQVVVEGVGYVWKHLRRSQQNPQGGRIQKESPIPRCKVQLVSDGNNEAGRYGVETVTVSVGEGKEKTRRYRVCKKTGEPMTAEDKRTKEKG